jgi:DNA-binding FadR family transcriptional regulator
MTKDEPGTRIGRVATYIRQYVADRGLTPGSPLPSEATISAQLGVSRPTVREGMRALAASGLITIATGKRAVVAAPDGGSLSQMIHDALLVGSAEPRDILEMRRGLEVTVAGLAAQRRTRSQIAELKRIVIDMARKIGSPNEFVKLDLDFHRALAEAADNPLYPFLIKAFHQAFERSMLAGIEKLSVAAELRDVQEVHEAIINAVDARDSARASAAMARHFDQAIARLLDRSDSRQRHTFASDLEAPDLA